jgi:putative tryptophan/tyrosine transport system substrate-binding protein
MRRREFLGLLSGAAAAWPLGARAQQTDRVRRIAVFSPFAESDQEVQANLAAFRQALEKLGWTVGRNIRIDYRWGEADPARILAQAKELVGLSPDAILVNTALALQPLMRETRTIPIIFTQMSDPVSSGFVASLARPGGNVTGFTVAEFVTFGKLLETLKEIAPQVMRVATIYNPDQVPQLGMLRAIEAAAPASKVQVTAAGVRNATDVEPAIDRFAREPNGGLIVLPSPITEGNRKMIIALAARYRLPAAYAFRHFVTDGGLISYGIDTAEQFRQGASYVDRVLRGEKTADLPVQLPTKFELVVNLKTAKALGIEVPATLLGRADEVIE